MTWLVVIGNGDTNSNKLKNISNQQSHWCLLILFCCTVEILYHHCPILLATLWCVVFIIWVAMHGGVDVDVDVVLLMIAKPLILSFL
jgi:hypothetical protein